jgi:hypothetical protein
MSGRNPTNVTSCGVCGGSSLNAHCDSLTCDLWRCRDCKSFGDAHGRVANLRDAKR